MIEIGATQAKRLFAFHEEEIALPQLFATLSAPRTAQDVKDDDFFRTLARIRCCFAVP